MIDPNPGSEIQQVSKKKKHPSTMTMESKNSLNYFELPLLKVPAWYCCLIQACRDLDVSSHTKPQGQLPITSNKQG